MSFGQGCSGRNTWHARWWGITTARRCFGSLGCRHIKLPWHNLGRCCGVSWYHWYDSYGATGTAENDGAGGTAGRSWIDMIHLGLWLASVQHSLRLWQPASMYHYHGQWWHMSLADNVKQHVQGVIGSWHPNIQNRLSSLEGSFLTWTESCVHFAL